MDYNKYVEDLCEGAATAARTIAGASTAQKNGLLEALAQELRNESPSIIEENAKDLQTGRDNNITDALYDRLRLDEKRIGQIAVSIEEIAALKDPVGRVEGINVMPSGIRVGQMRVPLGVVAVIFESRPNVTTDIAALCIKSGNAALLRGGKEAIHSNMALHHIIQKVLMKEGFDPRVVSFVDNTHREVVPILLKKKEYIDIVIPRGGSGLIKMVTEESTIPVIKHDKGLCHLFIDDSAEKKMAEEIAVNGKVQRPGVCNAIETMLVHKDYPYMKELINVLEDQGVEIRGCGKVAAKVPGVKPATEEDWDTEYLDLILSVKEVSSLDEAMDHIARYSSNHSEAIVTSDYTNGDRFLREVDSSALFVNASTRFHDGGEFGLGAEVGISTEKLHARGAMGVEGLTTLKYIVYGRGEVRS